MKRTKPVKKAKPTILANDPSIGGWGFAIIDFQGNVLHANCIKTKKESKKLRMRQGDDRVRRIQEINTVLKTVIRKYNVQYILGELPHGSQSASSAIMLGICPGILQTISDFENLPIEWYSEGDAKKALCGKISLSKTETIAHIKKIYNVQFSGVKYKDEAIADALAIHNVAMQKSPALISYRNILKT